MCCLAVAVSNLCGFKGNRKVSSSYPRKADKQSPEAVDALMNLPINDKKDCLDRAVTVLTIFTSIRIEDCRRIFCNRVSNSDPSTFSLYWSGLGMICRVLGLLLVEPTNCRVCALVLNHLVRSFIILDRAGLIHRSVGPHRDTLISQFIFNLFCSIFDCHFF